MKFLYVGLGNPGEKYQDTRHNIGFKTLDFFAKESGVFFSEDKLGALTSVKYKARTLYLLKPNTFMNLSGKAVRYWKQELKIKDDNLLVITDDLSLDFGTIRIRKKGSHGGHNGLKDIEATLQTSKYARLRFGIGKNFAKGQQVDYVLGEWLEEEKRVLSERLLMCKKACEDFSFHSISYVMNQYNNK